MQEFSKGDYFITSNKKYLNINLIHMVLQKKDWGRDMGFKMLKDALRNSICYGLYHEKKLVGFARVISDRSTFALITDMFVQGTHSRNKLDEWFVQCILKNPEFSSVRTWLAKSDNTELFGKFGFGPQKDAKAYLSK